ncbi:MAG TPA: GNAT family N-acetyltransferase [Thermoplasmata archaeon]|nr:GNAT family N-acetyltransferase [Thermoplasmata archaeon]
MTVNGIELRHIEKGQLDALVDAQNEIFSDYLVPMKSSRAFFIDFVQSVGGNIANVIVAMDGGRIVGYANPVVDRGEAWIGGVGVVPGHRGRGIGEKLMLAAEDFSRNQGAETSILEVIQGNTRAHGLYRRLGYEDVRNYVCAEGKPMQFAGYGATPRKTSAEELIKIHEEAYAGTCWQRRKIHGLIASAKSSECYIVDGGFVLVRKVDTTGYIPYLGVVPSRRGEGVGTSLAKFALNRLHELGTFKIAIYNLNEEPSVLRMLDKFDFAVTMKQIEMRKSLK